MKKIFWIIVILSVGYSLSFSESISGDGTLFLNYTTIPLQSNFNQKVEQCFGDKWMVSYSSESEPISTYLENNSQLGQFLLMDYMAASNYEAGTLSKADFLQIEANVAPYIEKGALAQKENYQAICSLQTAYQNGINVYTVDNDTTDYLMPVVLKSNIQLENTLLTKMATSPQMESDELLATLKQCALQFYCISKGVRATSPQALTQILSSQVSGFSLEWFSSQSSAKVVQSYKSYISQLSTTPIFATPLTQVALTSQFLENYSNLMSPPSGASSIEFLQNYYLMLNTDVEILICANNDYNSKMITQSQYKSINSMMLSHINTLNGEMNTALDAVQKLPISSGEVQDYYGTLENGVGVGYISSLVELQKAAKACATPNYIYFYAPESKYFDALETVLSNLSLTNLHVTAPTITEDNFTNYLYKSQADIVDYINKA